MNPVVEGDVVTIRPGTSPGRCFLTSYRADGTVFIQMDLPVELVRMWAIPLEACTIKEDATRCPRMLEIVK